MTTTVDITESTFQAEVIELARMLGWRVAHFRAARTKHGWVTPVAADGKGWPDLVLVRDRVIYAELKSASGRIDAHQQAWLDALADAGQEIHVWRPADLQAIADTLRRRTPPPRRTP